jgi:acyl-CoA reductase-like NAD-dependent aldehyde dehydrogenase
MPSGEAIKRREHLTNEILPSLDLRPFIDGQFASPTSTESMQVLEPATEATLAVMPVAGAEDVAAAVAAARSAFDDGPWPRMAPAARAAVLYRLADLIERDLEILAVLEASDTGKPISGVRSWDIPHAAAVYRYYADLVQRLTGDLLPPVGNVRVWTELNPVGVCAAIVPWNFPFPCYSWKVAPALAVGCCVVVKPAERAPLSGQALARLAAEAGLPPGVLNFVMGGADAGRALVADPGIDKITFTGDLNTARAIVQESSAGIPRLTLELGGKSANVVFADADLQSAVAGTIDAMFSVQGQNCCAGSRTFVQRARYDEFLETLVAAARRRRLGDPLDDATEQGPQIDRSHLSRIDGFVQRALADGATCAVGGKGSEAGALYYEPTIITGATPAMEISRAEVFGPVGNVYAFDSADDAITAANDTPYGLSASVWSADDETASRFARSVRVGTCWINCFGYFMEYAPWGGVKQSGHGRELGRAGIDEFLQIKTLFGASNSS